MDFLLAMGNYSADSVDVNTRRLYYYTNENSTMKIDFVFQEVYK